VGFVGSASIGSHVAFQLGVLVHNPVDVRAHIAWA
jgi:hypothetical protein